MLCSGALRPAQRPAQRPARMYADLSRAPYHTCTPRSLQRSRGRRGWLHVQMYQHMLSGAGPWRQGAGEGGDAPECTYAELARPQGARRQALFQRLSDPSAATSCCCVCGGGSKQRPAPAPSAGARPRPYWWASVGAARALRRVLRRLSAPYPRHSFPLSPCAVCLSRAACALSLPLVRLTSLPLASAAARGQWRASGAAAVGTAGPLPFVCESLSNCLLLAAALTSMEQGPMACARCL
jgi:hypothetical protein